MSNTYPLEAINDGYADMRTGRFLRGVSAVPGRRLTCTHPNGTV